MGFFNKKKNVEADVASNDNVMENTPDVAEDNAAQPADADRRFSLIVETATPMLDGTGLVVTGDLYGSAKVGDQVFVLQASGTAQMSKIVGIETVVDGKSAIVDEVTDATASLQIESSNVAQITRLAIITNIRPQSQIDVNTAVENPALSALLFAQSKFSSDPQFFGMITYHLAHGHFISPTKIDKKPVNNGDGTATFTEGAQIGFYMLKHKKPDEDVEKDIFPVFTDWAELRKWTALFADDQQVNTMIFTFQNIVDITKAPNFGGFVVNPFSKNSMIVNRALIEKITSLDGYQRDFNKSADDANASVKEVTMKKDAKVMLGVPKPSPEIDNIKQELETYGRTHAEVTSIDFLLKIEEENKQRYFVILGLDNPDKEVAKSHMEGIYQAIKNYAVAVREIEFALYGTSKGIDAIADKNSEASRVYSR